jgi:hypothetical protein
MSEEMVYPGEGDQNTPPSLGELAIVDHDIDPVTGEKRPRDEEPTTRIHSARAAEHIAALGEDHRSQAASYRSLARRKMEGPGSDLSRGRENFSDDVRSAESFMKGAAWHNKEASAIEDWALILHEHPPSTAFYEKNPGFDFSHPKSMIIAVEFLRGQEHRLLEVEDYVKSLEWENLTTKKTHSETRKASPNDVMKKLAHAFEVEFRGIDEEHSHIDGVYSRDDNREFREANDRLFELAEGDMTLREIADHLKKMAQERANKMSREIQDTRTMIDEVYSGRAAKYTGENDTEYEHHEENDQDHDQ